MIYSTMLCFTKMLFATLHSGVPWKFFEVLTIFFGIVLVIIVLWKTTLALSYATLLYIVHPGPHIYQLPWQPVLLAMSLGILLLMIVMGRSDLVVKVRVYQVM